MFLPCWKGGDKASQSCWPINFDWSEFWQGYGQLITSFSIIVLFYFITSVYYHFALGWNVLDSIYFVTVTITTIGYGDFHPYTDSERAFTIFTILFGLAFVVTTMNKAVGVFLEKAEEYVLSLANSTESALDLEQQASLMAKRHTTRIFWSIFAAVTINLLGTWVLAVNEDWTFMTALYVCVVTTTTVGYGDVCVTKDSSRLFLIFYMLFSVVMIASTITNLATIQIEREAQQRRLEHLTRPLKEDMINEMDTDGDGKIFKWEFIAYMVCATTDLDFTKDVEPWVQRFDKLDKDNSRFLNKSDIEGIIQEERAKKKTGMEKLQKFQSEYLFSGVSKRRSSYAPERRSSLPPRNSEPVRTGESFSPLHQSN